MENIISNCPLCEERSLHLLGEGEAQAGGGDTHGDRATDDKAPAGQQGGDQVEDVDAVTVGFGSIHHLDRADQEDEGEGLGGGAYGLGHEGPPVAVFLFRYPDLVARFDEQVLVELLALTGARADQAHAGLVGVEAEAKESLPSAQGQRSDRRRHPP